MLITTSRILLRPWVEEDLVYFQKINADPEVMRFFPSVLSQAESDSLALAIQEKMDTYGFGLWALELPGLARFAGFVGLNIPSFDSSLVEIGWRLHKSFWGKGFATEAAAAALETGFSRFNIKTICSFTAAVNKRSERVMQRLGMTRDNEFNHPVLPQDHPLSRHVLYRMTCAHWCVQKTYFPFLSSLQIF